MRSFLATTLLFFCLTSPIKGQIIADALPGCLAIDDEIGVNCNGSGTVFMGINGFGQYEVRNIHGSACCNVGGNTAAYFTFEEINISSFTNVGISIDYSAAVTDYEDVAPGAVFTCQNTNSIDNSHDQINFAYILDGVEILDLYVHGTTAADFTGNWSIGGLNGTTLQVKVWASNKAGAEAFFFENVEITADPPFISAGGDLMGCNGDDVMPVGIGGGIWSGGNGSFSDNTITNPTYTPGAGDENSTVVLNYAGIPASASCAAAYPAPMDEMWVVYTSPTATFTYTDPAFNGEFCSGDCADIDVVVTGGTPPYSIDWNIAVGALNVPLPSFGVASFTTTITVCYDPNIPFLPAFDAGTNTLTVPGIADGGTGTLSLSNITDDLGCSTTLSESVSVTFNTTPEMQPAFFDPECQDQFGQASFRLSDAIIDLAPTNGAPVSFYENSDMTGLINSDPYFTSFPGETVYAFASNGACVSDPIPINLVVLPLGDAGVVEFFCNGNAINCPDICDREGDGELIELTIVLEDPGSSYEVVISGGQNGDETFTVSGGTSTVEIFSNGAALFEIISIIKNGTCADLDDLGSQVEIDLIVPPLFDDPAIAASCTDVVLPPITGINLPPNPVYYSESNGMGTTFSPGTVLTMTDTLYLYGGVAGCDHEIMTIINIGGQTTYDQPDDVVDCGSYTLPPITGSNVGDSTFYYITMNGSAVRYEPGDIITSNITLFIYDLTSTCQTNQPSFSITLSGGQALDEINDTVACGYYVFPPIEPAGLLSGGEAYYTEPDAQGNKYEIGDTLRFLPLSVSIPFLKTTLYAFDSTTTCSAQEIFCVGLEYQGWPGQSDTIAICQGSSDLLNLPELIGGSQDTTGIWSSFPATVDLSDSTQVDPSGLGLGLVLFEYNIDADSVCADTSAFIRLEVNSGSNPGNNSTLTACFSSMNVNLENNLGIFDQGGTWVIDPAIGVDVSDPTNVDLSTATLNEFDIYYRIDATSTCGADSAQININLVDNISAGDSINSNICAGALIVFNDILLNNTSLGTIIDDSGSQVLGDFNTTGLNGVFVFRHVVSNPICPSDTALITLNITSAVSAGDNVTQEICNPDELLNLNSLLENADNGGVYFHGTDPISNEIIPSNFDVSEVFYYVVGDDIQCDKDSSSIQLSLVDFSLNISEDIVTLCPEAGRRVVIDYSAGREYIIYLTTTNTGTGAEYVISRTLAANMTSIGIPFENTLDGIETERNLEPGENYSVQLDSIVATDGSGCVIYIDEFFVINTELFLSVMVDSMICLGDSVMVEGINYGESTQFTETTTSGCTKETDIIISYFNNDMGVIDSTVCTMDPITIGDMTFSPQNNSGIATLDRGSSTGCDSLIDVTITYYNNIMGQIDSMVCSMDPITIGDMTFSPQNTNGIATLSGASAAGCDSLVDVNFTFQMMNTQLVDDIICGNQSIVIGGDTYDANNLNGTYTAPGQGSECDTLFTIALSIGSESIIVVDDAICGNEVILVAGVPYSATNATGQEMSPGLNGECDTIFNIALNVGEASEGYEVLFACDPNEIVVVGGLSLDIDNPTGTYLFGVNSSGCDSMVNVEVFFDMMGVDITYIDPLCEDDIAQFVINSVSSQNTPIIMKLNGDMIPLNQFPAQFALADLALELSIFDSQGCSFDIDTLLSIFPLDISISSTIVQGGEQLNILSNVSPDQITWTPATGLSCTNCPDPIANPEITTTYTAEVLFEDGLCSEILTVTVRVDETNIITLPNVLSIGGNTNNNVFYVKTDPNLQYQVKQMMIFDRWGNRVFNVNNAPTNDSSFGWDGRYKGMVVQNGVYPYFVVLESAIEGIPEQVFKGDITVIR